MPKRNLSLELHNFFGLLRTRLKLAFQKITPGALTQSREKLRPEVFLGMNQVLLNEYYTDNDERVTLWRGFRLLAIDGSKVTLPHTKELHAIYGNIKNQSDVTDVVQARASVLYDVLNNLVVDGILSPSAKGEVTLAHKHIEKVQNGDLLILDRGYPSFGLMWDILKHEGQFLFRCKPSFNNTVRKFCSSGEKDVITTINPKQDQSFKNKNHTKNDKIKVRLLRVTLNSGEEEILITSLLDKDEYKYDVFAVLYNFRWQIEVFYDRVKNIIRLENFSGLTNHAIQQDFNCALVISNIQTLLIEEAQMKLDETQPGKKHEYKINVSLSLGHMKNRLIGILTKKQPQKALKELESLLLEIPQPKRNGRTFVRVKDKYRRRMKPPMFKNRKPNI